MQQSLTSPTPFLPRSVEFQTWRRSERRGYDRRPRRHAELVVLLGLQGSVQYYVDGLLCVLGPGSLLFAHAGQAHFLVADTPDSDMWVLVISPMLLASGSPLPPLGADDAPADRGRPAILGAHGAAELSTLLDSLSREADPEVLRIGLIWWLTRAWQQWRGTTAHKGNPAHPAVALALHQMKEDPWHPLESLARQAGISLTRLGVLFRQQTNQTLGQYRTAQRLARAEAILFKRPHITWLEAALEAGFTDYSQFYRAYRSVHGHGPGRPQSGLPPASSPA